MRGSGGAHGHGDKHLLVGAHADAMAWGPTFRAPLQATTNCSHFSACLLRIASFLTHKQRALLKALFSST